MVVNLIDRLHNDVDADIAQAYVGLITSVPHGTPPVRHNGHPERAFRPTAHRARHRAHPSQHRSLLQRSPRAVDRHTVELRTSMASRGVVVLRITRRDEAAFTSGVHRALVSTERSIRRSHHHDRHRSEHSFRGRCRRRPASALLGQRRVDRHIDAPERATQSNTNRRDSRSGGPPWTCPNRAEARPEPISIARCRELLGDEADTLSDDEVLAVARHAEALAHILIALALQDVRIH